MRDWWLAAAAGVGATGLALVSSFWMRPDDPASAYVSTVLSLLLGIMAAGVVRARLGDRLRKLAALAGGAEAAEFGPSPRIFWMAGLGALLGVLVPPLMEGDPGLLLRPTDWDAGLAWSLLLVAAVFGAMGWLHAWNASLDAFLEREVTPRIQVDLLDLERLDEFGRRGTESAAFWLLGSSVAALLFAVYPFSLLHFAILCATIALGTTALLRPMLGVRRRVVEAREAELAAVRSAIRTARRSEGYPEALPAMLAWEARVAAINPWPFDAGSALRFGALGALAVGSWVGGALIERVVDATLG